MTESETNERQEERDYALNNLDDAYLTNLAIAGLTKAPEGQIPEYGTIFSDIYKGTIAQAPNQETWRRLYVPELINDEGALSKHLLMGRARDIQRGALSKVEVADVFNRIGSDKTVKEEYQGKLISELDPESQQKMISLYFNEKIGQTAEAFISGRRQVNRSPLEEEFCE